MARLRFCSRTLWLAALAATSVTSRAAIVDRDDRVEVRGTSASLYAPIGRVIGDRRAGTGFLVAECHVLTAQHNFSARGPAVGHAITFQAMDGHSSRGTIIASGELDVARQPKDWSEGRSRDWMLIRLDVCLGRSLGFVELAADQDFAFSEADRPVRSAGFPSGRRSPDTMMLDPSCRIRGGNFREWMNDCAALPGDSGSPIFQEVRSGGGLRLRVVAMVTCGEHGGRAGAYDSATANRATKMAYILPSIARFLAPAPLAQSTIQKGPGVAPRPFLVISGNRLSDGRP